MKKLFLSLCLVFGGLIIINFLFSPNFGQSEKLENVSYPASYMIETPNKFDYQPGYECSAFSSSYLLRHYGENINGLELFQDFPDKLANGGGVYPTGIVKMFQSKGYQAELIVNGTIDGLKKEISKGAPVIVYIHVYEPYSSPHCTHYVPIVGYDEDYFYFAESLDYMADSKDEKNLPYNRKTEITKFKKLWKNVDNYYNFPYFKITAMTKNI